MKAMNNSKNVNSGWKKNKDGVKVVCKSVNESSQDGWNEDKVCDVMSVCDDIYELKYELDRCIRGCYTGCETYTDLASYVVDLGERLADSGRHLCDVEEDPMVDDEEGGEEMVDESVEENDDGWFDNYGYLIKDIPEECVSACSHPGRCDDDVDFWVEELGFEKNFPVKQAKTYLKGFGAWEDDEIDEMDVHDLATKVLWIFCGYLKDEPDYGCSLDAY